MIHILLLATKAIFVPSGDQLGHFSSIVGVWVSLVWFEPFASIT